MNFKKQKRIFVCSFYCERYFNEMVLERQEFDILGYKMRYTGDDRVLIMV
jgi:hypothetical protein